jgi:hypothetical protein
MPSCKSRFGLDKEMVVIEAGFSAGRETETPFEPQQICNLHPSSSQFAELNSAMK